MRSVEFTPNLVSVVVIAMDYQIKYLTPLFDTLIKQTHRSIEMVLVDKTTNAVASRIAQGYKSLVTRCIASSEPAGFSENNNIGIRKCAGEFVFVLNLDTTVSPACIERLVDGARRNSAIGCVSPKVLRMNSGGTPFVPSVIDSAGMLLRRNVRHIDRGAGEVDTGQYDLSGYVFGATGAAVLFRRECLESLKIGDEYFDEDFWSYREDADICWRLQNYGWRCLYVPEAVVHHVRTLKPGPRSRNSRLANMHSVKNRFLLMLNNMSRKTYASNIQYIIPRDIVVLAFVLLREQCSLPGLIFVARNVRRLLLKRNRILGQAKLDAAPIWFENDIERAADYSGLDREIVHASL